MCVCVCERESEREREREREREIKFALFQSKMETRMHRWPNTFNSSVLYHVVTIS